MEGIVNSQGVVGYVLQGKSELSAHRTCMQIHVPNLENEAKI